MRSFDVWVDAHEDATSNVTHLVAIAREDDPQEQPHLHRVAVALEHELTERVIDELRAMERARPGPESPLFARRGLAAEVLKRIQRRAS